MLFEPYILYYLAAIWLLLASLAYESVFLSEDDFDSTLIEFVLVNPATTVFPFYC